MRDLVLWGGTGQARVLAEFAGALDYAVVALADNDPSVGSFLSGVPIFHGLPELLAWRNARGGAVHALVAVGGTRGRERLELQHMLAEAGFHIPTVVHPRAFVAADAQLGAGTQVLAMAAVGAGARVGAGCIINTSAGVDHECRLEDGVHVAPGATLAGNVTVGANAFIGTGACIVPGVHVGADAVVGAGAVVLENVPPDTVAYGNPARVRRATA